MDCQNASPSFPLVLKLEFSILIKQIADLNDLVLNYLLACSSEINLPLQRKGYHKSSSAWLEIQYKIS